MSAYFQLFDDETGNALGDFDSEAEARAYAQSIGSSGRIRPFEGERDTAAARLLDYLGRQPGFSRRDWEGTIKAIRRETAEAALTEVRAAVEGLQGFYRNRGGDYLWRAAVLAAIEAATSSSRKP